MRRPALSAGLLREVRVAPSKNIVFTVTCKESTAFSQLLFVVATRVHTFRYATRESPRRATRVHSGALKVHRGGDNRLEPRGHARAFRRPQSASRRRQQA